MARRELFAHHNRIKGAKPSQKNKAHTDENFNSDDRSITVRVSEATYRKREAKIRAIDICQVCEVEGKPLDHPHHAVYGSGFKDDRTPVCICVECHYSIHHVGYEKVAKTREEIEQIGWDNHDLLREVKAYIKGESDVEL